jgi:hypothetical protein
MIDVNVLIDRVKEETGFKVEAARNKEPDLQELNELPIIFIGYATIDSRDPSIPTGHDLYNMHGEDLAQSFDVQIVCQIQDLPTVWKAVYTSLIGFNPAEGQQIHTGFTYSQGGVMGLSNGKLWHIDRWRIDFPTLNVQF